MRTLYKAGDKAEAWGIKFDFTVVDDASVEAYLADGWVKSPMDIQHTTPAPAKVDANADGKLTTAEAKAYLDEHGVNYDGLHWKQIISLAEQHQKEDDK